MKERVKSFALMLLILMCICLASITWIDERLWPDGYSLFVNVKEWPILRTFFDDEYSEPLENLGKARKIVIADGSGASAVFYNSDESFDAVYADIGDLLKGFLDKKLEVKSEVSLTKENVRALLNEQIMYAYVNYPVAMEPTLYSRLMGIEESEELLELSAVRDFFILPVGTNELELLAIDDEDESVHCYEIAYDKTDDLINALTEYVEDVDPAHNCMLALEMNMDIIDPDMPVKMTTVLDSFLVLDSASTADPRAAEITGRSLLSEDTLEQVVQSFGYNPNSLFRYVDSQGTTVYLENASSLKIYQNGVIEFEALDPERGIELEGGTSLYESLNSAIRFAGKVYGASGGGGSFPVNVSSDVLLSTGSQMHFFFDYYWAGTPITADILLPNGDRMQHAVEMTVTDGDVTAFRMLLREYSRHDDEKQIMTIYSAIDKIAADHVDAQAPVRVEDVFLSYMEDGVSETLSPCWAGYADGKRIVITE